MAALRTNGSKSPSGANATQAPRPEVSEKASRSKDDAIKARIIKHMNAEHTESLSLYLRFYSGVPMPECETVKLVDISHDQLTIETSPAAAAPSPGASPVATHTVAIEPRLQSWSDTRPRVAAMDREARAGLGLPPLPSSSSSSPSAATPVPAYEAPHAPIHLMMIALVVWFYGTYAALRSGRLGPGHWYWEGVMRRFPMGGAEGYRWLNEALAWPVLVVHTLEAGVMAWRLRAARGVTPLGKGTALWWKWVGSALLEGWGAHQRLGAVLARGGDAERAAGGRGGKSGRGGVSGS